MSASALEPDPIRPDDFHTSLSLEYDAVLISLAPGLHRLPGVYCEECGAMNSSLFVGTEDGMRDLQSALEDGLLMTSWNDDDPRIGAVVCDECGFMTGMDLREWSVRVLELEDYREYADFRAERGEPL